MTEVKSYAYSFLVQSFLAAPRGAATPRSNSPAPGAAKLNGLQDQSEDGIETKEIDQVLSEATAMLGHWSLYIRFISSRAVVRSCTVYLGFTMLTRDRHPTWTKDKVQSLQLWRFQISLPAVTCRRRLIVFSSSLSIPSLHSSFVGRSKRPFNSKKSPRACRSIPIGRPHQITRSSPPQ